MQYVVHQDFIGKAICGEVNLSAGTKCTEIDGTIYYGFRAICRSNSNNACKFFSRDNDGQGMERGKLIRTIKNTLSEHPERWDAVLNDIVCRQFDKNPDGSTWEWNLAFYHASIATLRYIADLVAVKEE